MVSEALSVEAGIPNVAVVAVVDVVYSRTRLHALASIWNSYTIVYRLLAY